MPEKRYLKGLFNYDRLTVEIVKQSHIGASFGNFIASNGVKLDASFCPEFQDNGSRGLVLYLRGSETERHEAILDVSSKSALERIEEAFIEYNLSFKGLPCKCNGALVCRNCMKQPKKIVNF